MTALVRNDSSGGFQQVEPIHQVASLEFGWAGRAEYRCTQDGIRELPRQVVAVIQGLEYESIVANLG